MLGDGAGGPYRVPTGQWFGDSTVPDFTKAGGHELVDEQARRTCSTTSASTGSRPTAARRCSAATWSAGDGRKGDELHNAYPNAYTGAYDTYIDAKTGGTGVQFSRAGTSGAQGNSIFWAGDQASTFGAFQEAVRAGISAGQSGIPFWAWDLAGFTGIVPERRAVPAVDGHGDVLAGHAVPLGEGEPVAVGGAHAVERAGAHR